MLKTVIYPIFAVFGTFHFVHFCLYIIGANFYDIRNFRRNKNANSTKYLPLVSVVIPAYNEELSLARTINSVLCSNYPNIELIVVNDGSIDETELIAKYLSGHYRNAPAQSVIQEVDGRLKRVFQRSVISTITIKAVTQKNKGKATAVNTGIKKHASGELIMTLDADSLLDENAIRNSVAYFSDPTIVGVAANVRVLPQRTALGQLQRMEHLVAYRSKKLYSMLNCEIIVGGVASVYRKKTLKRVKYYDNDSQTEDIGLSMKIAASGNKKQRLIYADDVLAYTQGVQTYRDLLKQRFRWKYGALQNLTKHLHLSFSLSRDHTKTLTWYRLPVTALGELMLLFEPFLLITSVGLAVYYGNPMQFVGAYATITLYTLAMLLPDTHLTRSQKLRLSAVSLYVYFLFYIMSFVQIVAVYKCLRRVRQLTSKRSVSTDSRWTPPTRTRVALVAQA